MSISDKPNMIFLSIPKYLGINPQNISVNLIREKLANSLPRDAARKFGFEIMGRKSRDLQIINS